MKKFIQVVTTKKFLLLAPLIIIATLVLAYLSRDALYRVLYMFVFGGWSITFLYGTIKEELEAKDFDELLENF